MWGKLSVVLLSSAASYAPADPNDGMFLIALDNVGVPYGDPTNYLLESHRM